MKHGTKWMYIKYKCRCQPCTDANTTSHRKYMRKKYNRRPYENTIPRNIRIANINRLKENTSCVDCGGLFPAVCMDFDHRDPSLKRFSISQGFSNSPLTLMCEIAKCDIVCANCHTIRTYNRVVVTMASSGFEPRTSYQAESSILLPPALYQVAPIAW
ncbi:hypothetical protein LCGC14_2314900 [marine sediment metagenome]|uniref:HNH domain-containing protein n=1 Tax=marine sediment metagenome TaxID=412755 RepID=A0A0F9CJK5_9ZZZZ